MANRTKDYKLWLFGTYKWQGNPKALYLYMLKHCSDTHECWWIADNVDSANRIKKLGFRNVTYMSSNAAKELFRRADVYVTENFRESYPDTLSPDTIIFNTWHGVGLKHVELGLKEDSVLSDSIVRKSIRNFSTYKNQVYFLSTSEIMENHFLKDTLVPKEHMIRGGYPRNSVYQSVSTYQLTDILKSTKRKFSRIILFAPTYRVTAINGVFQYLLPDLEGLKKVLEKRNDLFIIKVHPFMLDDEHYVASLKQYEKCPNILFWNDTYDIYEIFNKIDIAIVDYSSIFYDLLAAGVNKFIRYIPDYDDYNREMQLTDDYFSLTSGKLVYDFKQLLSVLRSTIPRTKNKTALLNHFFSYAKNTSVKDLIAQVDSASVAHEVFPELHTFDVFDTLLRRKGLSPRSIFYQVQAKLIQQNNNLPYFLIKNWAIIRSQVESDVRDMYRKTTFERNSNAFEITFNEIFDRLKTKYDLSIEQIENLKKLELESEIQNIQPIKNKIDFLFNKISEGNDVALISDMYLPEDTIRTMLRKADARLSSLPLFLSTSIGYQKSTGAMYKHILFNKDYHYSKWVHYGDNARADGQVPRKYGIHTVVHHMDAFIRYESKFINSINDENYKYYGYLLATKLQRYRLNLIKQANITNHEFEKQYYAYAYAGMALVPYVHWCILDAINRGYETLYFISRDGYYLKLIADTLINKRLYNIKTKFIYGSRKAWRIPSFITEIDKEMFGPYGNFVGMDAFSDLVKASFLSENELLKIFPEFESLKNARHLRGEIAENIRRIASNSTMYRERLLEIAAEKRKLVKQYLLQNIDPNEKFAFVEFWGRGYTQDTFSRLLNDAFEKDVPNIFYYARSFSPDKRNIIRHNFMLDSKNYSYFEPIFASTPYDSISGYRLAEDKNTVEPIINHHDNSIHVYFEKGFINFSNDYLEIIKNDDSTFANYIAQFTYDYQINTFDDQYICNVFPHLNYNSSSYGQLKEYAPELNINLLEQIHDKRDLDKLTTNVQLSLSISEQSVRDYYTKIYKKFKLPAPKSSGFKYEYPENNLDDYLIPNTFPYKAFSIKSNAIYFDVGFNENTKRQDRRLHAGECFDVIDVSWLRNGVPRLLTKFGYVTANRSWVGDFLDEDLSNKNDGAVANKPFHTEAKTPKKKKVQPVPVSKVTPKTPQGNRKWKKFTRDPYSFFNDSKKPYLHIIKYLFNERHFLGRKLSLFVRKHVF